MRTKWLALLALLLSVFLLAGCTLRAEEDDDGDEDGGEISVDNPDDDDDDNDAPGAGLLVMGTALGVAAFIRRRST